MMIFIRSVALMALLTTVSALPRLPPLVSRAVTAADQILAIAPTSNTCAGATYADECATATQAAPYLISAMESYNVTCSAAIAAVISLMAYETGDFKYNTNHFPAPGRPGQGTRNMQMANYNLEYALSIPALVPAVQKITTATTTSGLSDDQLNAIRALVLPDQYSWATGAWFLTAQCAGVADDLEKDADSGFTSYMSCVGTTATSDRLAYFTRAKTAFGIS
jgi:hypothetical protein